MTQSIEFRRVVLGLHRGSADPASLQFAAEFAELLRLDLFGLFVREDSLLKLAELPFVREFRPLGGGWHPLSVEQLGRDLDLAVSAAQQLFRAATATMRVASSFEIVMGSMARVLATVPQAGDILVITQPNTPADRLAEPFASLLDSALKSAASVMLVPARIARSRGPVVAIAQGPADPSIEIAAAIAAAAKEKLVVVGRSAQDEATPAPALPEQPDVTSGIAVEHLVAPDIPVMSGPDLASLLGRLNERLVVMSRDATTKFPPALIAADRRVPVLIGGP